MSGGSTAVSSPVPPPVHVARVAVQLGQASATAAVSASGLSAVPGQARATRTAS